MATPTREAGGELPAREALEEIERTGGLSEAIRRRTSGITWMIWALTVAAIFVNYSYIGVVEDAYAADAGYLYPVLWLPWVALASGITALLWRSAGLVLPLEEHASTHHGALTVLLFLALIFGGLRLASTLGVELLEPATVLIAVGLATVLVGATGITTTSTFERRAAILAGVSLVLTAVASALLLPHDGTGYAWLSLIAPVASVVAYAGVGALVYARG